MLAHKKRKIEFENSSQRIHEQNNNIKYNMEFNEFRKQFKDDKPSIGHMEIWFNNNIRAKK